MEVRVAVRYTYIADDGNLKLACRLGLMTDEHAALSYGVPVLVLDGKPFGPGDLLGIPGVRIIPPASDGAWEQTGEYTCLMKALRAGYPVDLQSLSDLA